MFYRLLVLFCLISTIGVAQQTQPYQNTSLDEIFSGLSDVISDLQPGLKIIPPQKVHFFARYAETPSSCEATELQLIFASFGMQEMMKRVPISHCIKLATSNGHRTSVFIQDILTKGLQQDVKSGNQIEIYADFLGYRIDPLAERSTPVLLLNRFEPVDPKPEHG